MTKEAKAYKEADPSENSEERRYRDPYGLYRRWFEAPGEAQTWTYGETVSPEELGELWRRWLETMTGALEEGVGTQNGLAEAMAPLWEEMAGELSEEMLSEGDLPEDPVRCFVRWYRANGERWSEAADQHLRKEEVLESVGRFFEAYARSHKQLRQVSEEGLKNLRVPTRSDVARVAKLVVVVENKVDRIEEAFEEFIHGDSEPADAAAMGRLEERMDRLEGKMDRILDALEKLGADEDGENPSRANGRGAFPGDPEEG
jgi:polyhydroxyalkanoic acid synthase PhaR subunit